MTEFEPDIVSLPSNYFGTTAVDVNIKALTKFTNTRRVQVGCYHSIQIMLLSIKECSISSPSQPSSASSEVGAFQIEGTPNNAASKSYVTKYGTNTRMPLRIKSS
jgi:hypothetical protein